MMTSNVYGAGGSLRPVRTGAFAVAFALCAAGLLGLGAMAGARTSARADVPHSSLAPAGSTATPSATPNCEPVWGVTYTRNAAPGGSELKDVDAISTDDVWAVGNYLSVEDPLARRTMVQHWNGRTWSRVPSPNVDASHHLLTGVSALSAADLWAVGYRGPSLAERTLTLHWDGAQFSAVPSPNAGSDSNFLLDVAAVASNDVWAVGYVGWSYSQTLIEHWDGGQWSVVPSPNTGARSALYAVTAMAANDIWAVGSSGFQPDEHTLVVHWDGTAWSIVDSPNVGANGNWLRGVGGSSSNDVWAVGTSGDLAGLASGLALHWDGMAWSVVPTPQTPYPATQFEDIAAISATDAWVVGHQYLDTGGWYQVIEHWDGAQWSIVFMTAPEHDSQLYGVDAVGASDVWAVGNYITDYSLSLAEHYASPCATPSPMPTVTPCPVNFTDVHPGEYFYPAVQYLYCAGIISGYGDNTFRPYSNTTRGQICKIVMLAEGWVLYAPTTPTFTDVPTTHPFYAYIETAALNGVVSGYYGGAFLPYNDVTRGQLAKIVTNAQGWPDYIPATPTFRDVGIYDPFYRFVETAYHHGIISGYSCGPGCLEFRPGNNATRGQISKMVYNAITGP